MNGIIRVMPRIITCSPQILCKVTHHLSYSHMCLGRTMDCPVWIFAKHSMSSGVFPLGQGPCPRHMKRFMLELTERSGQA